MAGGGALCSLVYAPAGTGQPWYIRWCARHALLFFVRSITSGAFALLFSFYDSMNTSDASMQFSIRTGFSWPLAGGWLASTKTNSSIVCIATKFSRINVLQSINKAAACRSTIIVTLFVLEGVRA
jgi:hypothetical protein